MTVFLVLAGIGLGVWIGERDARRKYAGWRPFNPRRYPHWNRYQIMRDCKGI